MNKLGNTLFVILIMILNVLALMSFIIIRSFPCWQFETNNAIIIQEYISLIALICSIILTIFTFVIALRKNVEKKWVYISGAIICSIINHILIIFSFACR